MSLTISEIGLLRSLVEWRRANGWTREYRLWDLEQHDHTYEHKDSGLSVEATMHRIELIPGEPKVVYEVGVEACGHLLFHGWPWSVRSAVNGIAAAEVIPPEMAPMHSSAFAAGRESAYDRDEWRVCAGPAEFPVVFQDEIFSDEHLAIVLRDARNRWRGEAIWVQHRRNGSTSWDEYPRPVMA